MGASFQLAHAFDKMKSCRHKKGQRKSCHHKSHRHLILKWFRTEGGDLIGRRRGIQRQGKTDRQKNHGLRTPQGIEVALFHPMGYTLPEPKAPTDSAEEAKSTWMTFSTGSERMPFCGAMSLACHRARSMTFASHAAVEIVFALPAAHATFDASSAQRMPLEELPDDRVGDERERTGPEIE